MGDNMRTSRNLLLLLFVTFLLIVNNSTHLFSNISTLSVSPATGSRGTFRVNTTGSGDYITIQAAIDNATTGDTIFVDPGTYTENIMISKSLQLMGSGSDVTVIEDRGEAGAIVYINANWVNISGFLINNSWQGNSVLGITINDSDNCVVQRVNITNCDNGIYLLNSNFSIISNNYVYKNLFAGIVFDRSNSNMIENNTCNANHDTGIRIEESESNQIFNNTLVNNWNCGISVWSSNMNTISRNTCEDNTEEGIYIFNSNSNTISNNTCNDNGEEGIYISTSQNNSIHNNTCDSNSNVGINLYGSNSNTILNNICSNGNFYGIYISYSDTNLINNNTCNSNTWYGIQLRNSHRNNMFDNTYENNDDSGIIISYSDFNTIERCESDSNWGSGIWVYQSDSTSVLNNSCLNNSNNGVYIAYSDDCLILNNTCKDNYYDGLYLRNSDYNSIVGNNFSYSQWSSGISIYTSDSNEIINNSCLSNDDYGIIIRYSDYNRVISNRCLLNKEGGTYIYGSSYDYSDYNYIDNNSFNHNGNDGISLINSNSNEIINNSCFSNQYDGISAQSSNFNIISNNRCENNEINGIDLYYLDNNTISKNNCSFNENDGINLYYLDNNTISKNNCSFNENDGISLSNSHQNNIRNNSINSNNGGIDLSYSQLNIITGNTCLNSRDDGIKLSNSSRNNVRNNSINSNDDGIELRYSYSNNVIGNTCLKNNNGTYLYLSDDNIISGIISKNNVYGIRLYGAHGNQLSDSVWSRNERDGIYLEESNNSIILNNHCFSNNGNGTTLMQSNNNNIYYCQYGDNYNGISISDSWRNEISNNTISTSIGFGIALFDSHNTIIEYNSVSENTECGINIKGSNNNNIHHNDLIHRHLHIILAYDDGQYNSWDDGKEGNYWSNYYYRYYGAEKLGKVWDTPYEIEGNFSQDNFSLRFPVDMFLEVPIAYAGLDVTIEQFDKFVFNSTLSFDHIGIGNYSWSFRYNGRDVLIFGPSPSFGFDITGTYEVLLTITNTRGREDNDTFFIIVLDKEPPWIDVYENIIIDQHESALFDASNCSDNHGITNVTWMVEYLGETYLRYGMRANFTFPEAGLYPVTIQLNDSRNNSNQSLFYVRVRDITPPLPVSGSDQTVDQYEKFYLDASWSTDNVGIVGYTWTFFYKEKNWTSGGSQMDFTFYEVGTYIIVLNVSDEAGNWAKDHVTINVLDVEAPLADAGGNLTANTGEKMRFNGTASTDNVGIYNYSWSFPYLGAQMVIYGPNPEYIFPESRKYQVKLTVTDKAGNTNFDIIYVFVSDEVLEIPEDDKPKEKEKTDKDNLSFYLCSAVLIGSILIVVILNILYKKKKVRNLKGKAEDEEVSGMIDDISDSFFKKREDEEYDYRLPKVVLRKKEAEPKRFPRIKEAPKKKVLVKVIRKKITEPTPHKPKAEDEEVIEVEPLDLSEEFDEDEDSEQILEDQDIGEIERSGEDTDSETTDEKQELDEQEKSADEEKSAETEEEKEISEKEKSIEEIMFFVKAELETMEEGDEFKNGFLQGYERALEELRDD